jgi:hypothetical protein
MKWSQITHMEKMTVFKFDIQSTRSECFGLSDELENLFKSLKNGKIPDDLDIIEQRTVGKLRRRGQRLLQIENGQVTVH